MYLCIDRTGWWNALVYSWCVAVRKLKGITKGTLQYTWCTGIDSYSHFIELQWVLRLHCLLWTQIRFSALAPYCSFAPLFFHQLPCMQPYMKNMWHLTVIDLSQVFHTFHIIVSYLGVPCANNLRMGPNFCAHGPHVYRNLGIGYQIP